MLTYDDADHRCRRQRRQRSVVAQRRRRERGAGRLQGQAWRAREVSEGEANGCTGLWTPARPLWRAPGPLEREPRAQRAWRRAAGAKNFEMQSANKRFPSVFCAQAPMTHKPHQSTAVYH